MGELVVVCAFSRYPDLAATFIMLWCANHHLLQVAQAHFIQWTGQISSLEVCLGMLLLRHQRSTAAQHQQVSQMLLTCKASDKMFFQHDFNVIAVISCSYSANDNTVGRTAQLVDRALLQSM
jgi:hypothetical protein